MKKIQDIVDGKPLIFVGPREKVRNVAKRMAAQRIGAVPVIDDGKLVGIFTERDLMTRAVARNLDLDTLEISAVMTREIAVASPLETVDECLERMMGLGCRHLPVVDRGALVGIVSLRDLLQVENQQRGATVSFLRELVTYKPEYES
ncbi:MAG: CBS domain-containing protein [Thermoanaerobaculia bacterium]